MDPNVLIENIFNKISIMGKYWHQLEYKWAEIPLLIHFTILFEIFSMKQQYFRNTGFTLSYIGYNYEIINVNTAAILG